MSRLTRPFPLLCLSLLVAAASYSLQASASSATVCDPHSFGAKGDGATADTKAIQSAIDSCAQKGGGVVQFSAGTYLSAPLTLKSHVHLNLDKGATLLGSTNFDDYPVRKDATWRRIALLHADDQEDIGVTGSGTIDGQGQPWWTAAHEHRIAGDTLGSAGFARPLLIDLVHSKHILFEGIAIRNSPMYNITLFVCEDIIIRNVTINNPARNAPNTDGIDPFSSSHIVIDHVAIDTGDDDIAIKSGLVERGEPNIPSTDISITNSTLLHGHGLAIGSETAGGVRNVTVDHVTFKGTDAGVRIKSNRGRGNDMGNFSYSNISMEDVTMPIQIVEYYPKVPATDTAQPMTEHTPRFHDISISNLTATGAKAAGNIQGLPESPIKGLTLTNINIAAATGISINNADVAMRNVVVTPASGPAFINGENAHVTSVK